MPGADRQFTIKILTPADTTGIKETKSELNSLSPETQKYIKNLQEQESWANKNELSHRQMTNALRHLSPELGSAAHEMHLMSAGPMGAVIAGGLIITEVFKKIGEAVEHMREELAQEMEIRGMVDAAIEVGAAWRKARESAVEAMDAFEERLKRLANAQETLKEKTNDAVEALKHQAELDKKDIDEKEKRDLAKVKMEEKAGTITHDQAAEQEAAIKEKYQQERDQRASKAESEEIAKRKEEKVQAAKDEEAAVRDAREKGKTDKQAQIDLGAKQDELKGLEDKSKALMEQYKKMNPDTDAARTVLKDKTLTDSEAQRLRDEELPSLKKRALETSGDRKEAEKKAEDLATLLKELERTISKLEGRHGEGDRSRAGEAETRRQTRDYETEGAAAGSKLGKMVGQASDAEMAHEQGRQGTLKQEAAFQELHRLLGTQADIILRGLAASTNSVETHTKQIADLVKRMEAAEKKAHAAHNP